MRRKRTLLLVIVVILAIGKLACAGPIWERHDWTIKTPCGRFGIVERYDAWDEDPLWTRVFLGPVSWRFECRFRSVVVSLVAVCVAAVYLLYRVGKIPGRTESESA
jgi:hypothetical protein